MNPFSAFLQPVSRPLQAPDAFGDLSKMVQSRKELSERQREADQNNSVQQGYLKVQQDQQSHKFAEQDRNEVEGLIKEYQDAVARGEPQQIQDAIQKMKRFGLDVQQEAAKEQAKKPDNSTSISPFTGLPFQPHSPFQNQQSVASDGTANSGVRADDPNDDRLLGQKEFEDKLVGDTSVSPEQMESGGQTTQEGKDYLQKTMPQSQGISETTDLSPAQEQQFQAWARRQNIRDVDNPDSHYDYRGFWLANPNANVVGGRDHFPDTFKQHGHPTFSVESRYSKGPGDGGTWNGERFQPADPGDAGRNGNVMDLDAEAQAAPQQGQASQIQPGLPGMLPIIVSRQGKELYRSGNQGRWSPLVQGVFGPLAAQQDPKAQAAGQRAQALAEKLVGVDGVSPEQAIKFAMDAYEKDLNRTSAELRTTIGAKARQAAPQRETAESIDKYGDNIEMALQHTGIPAADAKLSAAEDAIMSDDPALQKDALKMILQARSGLTVSEGERRSYTMVDGLLPYVQNQWAQWSGQPMSPQTRQSLLNIIQNMRQANSSFRDAVSAREVERYKAQNENKLAPKVLERRAGALGAPLKTKDPNADLDQ